MICIDSGLNIDVYTYGHISGCGRLTWLDRYEKLYEIRKVSDKEKYHSIESESVG